MSFKASIKNVAKKVIPDKFHPFMRARVLPALRRMRGYSAPVGFHNGRGDLYAQIQEIIEKSKETDQMIIGLLKSSQVAPVPGNEIEAKLDLILSRLDNMEAQFRETDKTLLAFIKMATMGGPNLITMDYEQANDNSSPRV